jgi:hypothetical protein
MYACHGWYLSWSPFLCISGGSLMKSKLPFIVHLHPKRTPISNLSRLIVHPTLISDECHTIRDFMNLEVLEWKLSINRLPFYVYSTLSFINPPRSSEFEKIRMKNMFHIFCIKTRSILPKRLLECDKSLLFYF